MRAQRAFDRAAESYESKTGIDFAGRRDAFEAKREKTEEKRHQEAGTPPTVCLSCRG